MKRISFLRLALFFAAAMLMACAAGCRASKSSTEKAGAVHAASAFALDGARDGVGEFAADVSVRSLLSQWQALVSAAAIDREGETIREVVTVTTDSAGSATRVEDRITTRSRASQSMRSEAGQGSRYEEAVDCLASRLDSLGERVRALSVAEGAQQASESVRKESGSWRDRYFWWLLLACAAVVASAFCYVKKKMIGR